MNRKEFMEQLERLLMDIPEQERAEALDYYESYFDDAGEEQEAQVIQELGSPGKAAAMIKADIDSNAKGNREEYGEYTEAGYTDARFEEKKMPESMERARADSDKDGAGTGKTYGQYGEKSQGQERRQTGGQDSRFYGTGKASGEGTYRAEGGWDGPYKRAGAREKRYPRRRGFLWLWIILAVIFVAPVLGGLGLGLLGALLGLALGILGIAVGLGAGGIGMIFGGIIMLVRVFLYHLSSPATALAAGGASLVVIALGILFFTAFLWLLFKAVPAVFRWSVDFIQRILYRGRRGGDRT